MAISTINQNGLNAPLTLTSPVLTTPTVTGGTFSSPTMTTPALGTPSAINLSNATALPSAALPTGSVKQVIQSLTTSVASTTSQSFVASNLSAVITPSSASSKIYVMCSLPNIWNGGGIGMALYRNGSTIFQPSSKDGSTSYYYCYGAGTYNVAVMNFLDSPSSTSAQTYAIYISSYNGTQTVFMPHTGGANNACASMTLMEIAG